MTNQTNHNKKWSFFIDRGGTFTDIIAQSPNGTINAIKLLSQNPDHYKDAAIEGIRLSLGVNKQDPIPANTVNTVRMGTTVATNALLEHKGEPTLLLTSQGLSDCLEIGTQARNDIFALNIQKPTMLYAAAESIDERVDADGTLIIPLDESQARKILERHYRDGIRSLAILFMHSYKYPTHENTVAQIANEIGYTQISVSHKVSPLIKYIPRGDTTMVDAYLTPLLHHYTNQVQTQLDTNRTQIDLSFMTSSGALSAPELFHGKDAILSGPAGGIVGAAKTAKQAGFDKIICFDMGGTSTDVAHYNGNYDISFETQIAGNRLQAPMLHIHTVAAGGGSILGYENARMNVGPESAGAHPGPLCYRNNGPLTITDANLMTGRIDADTFPHIFGPNQDQPLDKASVETAFEKRAAEIDPTLSPATIAEGYIRIANENMAAAIKKISVERGIDVSTYTLQCYGGAGGQHAAAIAQNLGIPKVFIHAQSGLLSAFGMGLANPAARRRKMLNLELSQTSGQDLKVIADDLSKEAQQDLIKYDGSWTTTPTYYLAYQGVETKLPIPLNTPDKMRESFEQAHKDQFGFLQTQTPIFIEQIEVEVALIQDTLGKTPELKKSNKPLKATKTIQIFDQGEWQQADLYDETKQQNLIGHSLNGPALLIEPNQTIFVPKGWSASKTLHGHVILDHKDTKQDRTEISTTKPDPIRLELFNSLFMSIAEQMGEALRATAQSVNIKERLDFSCALFDQTGALIANAPHMPVHLGSMDQAVSAIIKANPNGMQEGDAFMINAPYSGGTHLPDITVITPVFEKDQVFEKAKLIAFVAARGHHADIGGITPGSMSPMATNIHEEGITFDNVQIVKNGVFQEHAIKALLTNHQYPARNPQQNIADLKAQLAACAKGVKELQTACNTFGTNVLQAYMDFVQTQAEMAVKELIERIATDKLSGQFEGNYKTSTDQGTTIALTITPDLDTQTLTIDFTGTSGQTNDNFNAPAPVTRAAVLYVLRTLVKGNIPMNAGCLRPINLIIPENSLLAPTYPAAVVAGNVETSQVVTNCLYGAFGCLGLAQGTMNNLTFGDETYQYYETLCSGAPAGPGFDGSPAVHTHMTNSRLTDPEILETRYPVILKEFCLNKGSGGKGKWNAGDGISRTLTFKAPMTLSLLTGYREKAIPGVKGGLAGQKGQNILSTPNGTRVPLKACSTQNVNRGDSITIITPTGGGYGKKS